MPLKAYDLTGRTALITGAAGGIGRACAVLLAEAGATVHCADLDEAGLRETAALIGKAGGTAHAHPWTSATAPSSKQPSSTPSAPRAGSTSWPPSPASCTAAPSWTPGTKTSIES